MRADPGSVRERLKESTQEAWKLYCALEVMLPYKEVSRGQPISRQKLSASTIPWHGSAAALISDFYAGVRRLEVNLRAAVTGISGARRGGSDGNTRMALQAIVNLSHAAAVDDQTAQGILGFFDRWIRQAHGVFDPDHGLHRIPRSPGEKEPACPWCAFLTMRWQPATGILICINPECRDGNDQRPRWQAEYTIVGDQTQFSWEPIGEEGA